ncbi:unnamed protein product, partial [Effrenium voratum]
RQREKEREAKHQSDQGLVICICYFRSVPQTAPAVPNDITEHPVPPLPGMLYPVPAFRPAPGTSEILAEPGDSFRPKILREPSLLQSNTHRRLRHGN